MDVLRTFHAETKERCQYRRFHGEFMEAVFSFLFFSCKTCFPRFLLVPCAKGRPKPMTLAETVFQEPFESKFTPMAKTRCLCSVTLRGSKRLCPAESSLLLLRRLAERHATCQRDTSVAIAALLKLPGNAQFAFCLPEKCQIIFLKRSREKKGALSASHF